MRSTRLAAVAAIALVALVLSGCVGLPSSGPVTRGLPVGEAPAAPDFLYRPDRPAPGASAEEIVAGFLAAGTSPASDWEIARLFLAPEAEWDPSEAVTIEAQGSRTVTGPAAEASADAPASADPQPGDVQEISVTTLVEADVDATGLYRPAERGAGEVSLAFTLERQENGEWRITRAPNGIVIDENDFPNVYRSYALMYYDPSWTYLVPDVRWFPYRSGSAARIVRALVDGSPSPWLAGSVATAFPEQLALASAAVTLTAQGVAQIELDQGAVGLDPTTIARMQRQLLASLQFASVTSVDLRVGATSIAQLPADAASTAVDARPLVVVNEGAGFLDGGDLDPLAAPVSDAVLAAEPDALTLARGGGGLVLRDGDGRVVRVGPDGETRVEDDRDELIAPSLDPEGIVWSVPRSAPAELRATFVDGEALQVANAWPGATRVSALRVSRDGARVAANVTIGQTEWVVVSGIVRGAGAIALSEPLRVAPLEAPASSLDWLDDATLGATVEQSGAPAVLAQPVGGPTRELSAPSGVTTVSAGATAAGPRVLGDEGVLSTRRAAAWQQIATEVSVLGWQLGG